MMSPIIRYYTCASSLPYDGHLVCDEQSSIIAKLSNFLITKYSFICMKATTFGYLEQLCDL
jgi:hypothetical protein